MCPARTSASCTQANVTRSISRYDSARSAHGHDGTAWGVGLDSGDDAPQRRECDLSGSISKSSRAQQGFAPEPDRPVSLAAPATVRDTTTRSCIRVSWQRRPYIEAAVFVMTYMNAWPDRWRGSNDLGRAPTALVHPAKLCDWIKISHVSPVGTLAHMFVRDTFLKDVKGVIQHCKQVGGAWGARPSSHSHPHPPT